MEDLLRAAEESQKRFKEEFQGRVQRFGERCEECLEDLTSGDEEEEEEEEEA